MPVMAQEHKQFGSPYLLDNLFFLREIVRLKDANGTVASFLPLLLSFSRRTVVRPPRQSGSLFPDVGSRWGGVKVAVTSRKVRTR